MPRMHHFVHVQPNWERRTSSPPPLQPPPFIFSPQLGSAASLALIGLTAAHSPHLLVGIGWQLFSFLDGHGQGTLGYRVLKSHSTCFTAPAVDYESQHSLPPPPPLSPNLL
ncbi:hypothetical protein KUCAC02_022410 [Chaenocephalus aceratus]|uniref:Uncharacterized protein n=1 Tax=Chaenocephalus aceratus TaxID=36190 RepID=A0ACB9XND6_CHAAC|nr:hypothetical protein KUCAC02_022410 [Chaenocephalus aceratus]